jgi:hypothetical protein
LGIGALSNGLQDQVVAGLGVNHWGGRSYEKMVWLPERYTKEIPDFQRVRDDGKPLIVNMVW